MARTHGVLVPREEFIEAMLEADRHLTEDRELRAVVGVLEGRWAFAGRYAPVPAVLRERGDVVASRHFYWRGSDPYRHGAYAGIVVGSMREGLVHLRDWRRYEYSRMDLWYTDKSSFDEERKTVYDFTVQMAFKSKGLAPPPLTTRTVARVMEYDDYLDDKVLKNTGLWRETTHWDRVRPSYISVLAPELVPEPIPATA